MHKNTISLIFNKYLAYNLHLKNLKKTHVSFKNKKALMKKYESYIQYIDDILSALDQTDARFLKNVFVNKCSKDQMGYSISGYYFRYKTALNHFLDLYDQELIS